LFQLIGEGTLAVEIGQTWSLADVQAAHEALERRATIGATVLIP
jgi:NADPH2:quinone reductase